MNISDFVATYPSLNTRKAYTAALQAFVRFAGQQVLSAKLVDDYRSALYQHYGCAATVNQMVSALRAYGSWAHRMGELDEGVAKHLMAVKGYRKQEKLPRLLSDTEVSALLASPDVSTLAGRRDRAILWVLHTSGMRVSELVGLDVADVVGNKVHIRSGKGQKDRIALISDTTAAALAAYSGSRDNGSIFQSLRGHRLTTRAVQDIVSHYGALVGRPDLHPHLLRHCFATTLLDETANLVLVATLMGHSDIRTTQHYAKSATKYAEVAHRAVFI